ncbi:MAG: glycosyltransferase, partial [Candidatus Aminicenantes bacterium]|nr:glycosyltransferase [Candidatus Aminicenantes bacterium]
TPRIVARLIKDDARCRLLSERPDKTAQLNAALERGAAPWVLVTDADSRMSPETLGTMVSAAQSDESLGAVGAPVEPADGCHWLERAHWRISNRVRALESRSGCASLVTGPCYLVRRDVINRIPGDVVADDIHAALAAARLGLGVCLVETPVTELRTPRSLSELFRHKLRKTTAYLREVFRFLPACLRMPGPARGLFLWRAAQLIVLPWLVAAAFVWLALSPSPLPAAALGLVVLGGGAVALLASVDKDHDRPRLWTGLALAVFLLAVCLAAGITYPLRRRSACYPKVGAAST